jgi:phage terminase Nu1 subunit (DNA packaging protein)
MPRKLKPKKKYRPHTRANKSIDQSKRAQKPKPSIAVNAIEKKFGALLPEEKKNVFTYAERFAMARAVKEEEGAKKAKMLNRIRSGELLEAAKVMTDYLRIAAGIRREIDSIPQMIQGITVSPDPLDPLRKAISHLQTRLRAVMSNADKLREVQQQSAQPQEQVS